MLIAHVNHQTMQVQTLEDHAKGVANLASNFASTFGMPLIAYIMGLLHDKGKERNSFQSFIRSECGIIDSEYPRYNGEDKQHAYIGASILRKDSVLSKYLQLIGFQIMGHHAGLPDYTSFEKRMEATIPDEIGDMANLPMPESLSHIATKFKSNVKEFQLSLHHLSRVLFSCLVDADFLDTEKFMSPNKYLAREKSYDLGNLLLKLDEYMSSLMETAPHSPINSMRNQILDQCILQSKGQTGFYSLNVPTGTGKTLSSISWALRHAICHNKKRVIYAIPYTSIVAQTAKVLSDIFGSENVLEHHSNVTDMEDSKNEAIRLASENWDYPIIVTTNVQLFQSMMSNKVSKCRKLHNLANSVLVLDEVQTLPLQHLQPILDSLKAYNKFFDMSVLFCTASMPVIGQELRWGNARGESLSGIENIIDIVPRNWNLQEKIKRCDISLIKETLTNEQLAQRVAAHSKVLCVVNSRKVAKDVFELLQNDGKSIHLSRMMCPVHLKEKLNEIKQLLSEDSCVRVISTQLIEAGVDIDFPAVFRQEAGLDSVLQAAGRCNREGKLEQAMTYVFRLAKKPHGDIGRACDALNAASGYFENDEFDWYNSKSMYNYFLQRYARCETFDKANIRTLLGKQNELMFETAAKNFKLIDDDTVTLIVNYGESPELMNKWRHGLISYSLRKQLLQYSVNVHQSDFRTLLGCGAIEEINGIYYVPFDKFYSSECGLLLENKWLEESLIL